MQVTDYDRPLFKADEIIAVIGRPSQIELCEKHDINYRVIASEMVHTKREIKDLEAITPSFREETAHAEKIAVLKQTYADLETELNQVFTIATDREEWAKREASKAKAKEKIIPLLDQLKTLSKELENIEMELVTHRADLDVIPDGHLFLLAQKVIQYSKSGRAD